MKNEGKTKKELIAELAGLRRRIAELEASESERKRAVERIQHLNMVLHAIRKVNQLIAKEKDRVRLVQGACDMLTETRGYHNAWVALLDNSGKFKTCAEAGLADDFLPMREQLERGELPACGRKALAEPGVLTIKDPISTCRDCPLSKKYGGRGAMTVRLEYLGQVYGLLSVSIPVHLTTDQEEKTLFQELAGDIAFGLHGIELEQKRIQADEALRESEERWRSLVKNAPDMIIIVNPDSTIRYINRGVPGFTPEQVIGTSVYEYVLPEHHDTMRKSLQRVLQTGEADSYQVEGAGPHGATSWYATRVGPIKHRGEVVAATLIVTDITDRKRAEEALKDSEALYHSLVESLPQNIVRKDVEGKFTFGNTNFLSTLGKRLDEVVGKTDFDFYPEELAQKHRTDDKKVLETGETFEDVEEHHTPHGQTLYVRVVKTPVYDSIGQVTGVQGIFWDVTERKRAEEQRKALARLGTRLAEADTVESMIEAVREETDRLLAWDAHYFAVRRPEEDTFHVVSFVDTMGGKKKTFRKNNWPVADLSPPGRQVLAGRPILINRAPGDPKPVLRPFGDEDHMSASLMHVPVRSGQNVIGIISAQSYTPGRYNEADLQTLQRIADAIAPALERAHATEALRQSEEKYRMLFNSSSDAVFVWRVAKDGRPSKFIQLNDTACRTYGYTRHEFLDLAPGDIDAPKDSGIAPEFMGKLLSEKSILFELQHVSKSGETFPVEISSHLFELGGEPTVVSAVRDITERNRAEEALRESEERYRRLVENINLGITLIAPDRKIIMTNAAQGRLFKKDPREFVGKYCFREFEKREAICAHCPGTGALAIGRPADVETEGVRDDGSRFTVRIHAFPVFGPDGAVTGFIEVVEDITDRKNAEEGKRLLQEQLAQAQKMEALVTLSGGIAHEFNNILAVIVGYTDLTLQMEGLSSTARKNLAVVRNSGARGADLTKNLLAFSRKEMAERKPVNLISVVDEVLSVTQKQFTSEGIDVSVEHSVRLPLVMGDAGMLSSVLMNLVINARHAMLKSPVKKLSIRMGLEKDRAFIRVKDTGCGIPEENLSRVFEPFFTTKGSMASGEVFDGKARGTGLGLSVCHSIIEGHGGEMKVSSQVGKGTTFTVYLPPVSSGEKKPREPRKRPKKAAPRILVVDDEEAITDLLVDILDAAGYAPDGFTNPIEALKALRSRRYSLAFIDLQMPEMPGEHFLKEVNDLAPEKRPLTVILTGRLDRSKEHYEALGVLATLTKPFDTQDVLDLVKRGLTTKACTGKEDE